DQLASPATKRRRMATSLFIAMVLEDGDRDVRQAAAEALGRLGGERARHALTRAASDLDGDVAAATQMALQALGPESNNKTPGNKNPQTDTISFSSMTIGSSCPPLRRCLSRSPKPIGPSAPPLTIPKPWSTSRHSRWTLSSWMSKCP